MLNANLFSTVTPTRLNEFHVTYSRESRPRSATASSVPADTAMGFATSFRFGNPFFLAPTVDELVKRFQVKNNLSIVSGTHTIKAGGEWQHTNNAQVFRGFFEGRYIFDSVVGFLRYASPAGPERAPATLSSSPVRSVQREPRSEPGVCRRYRIGSRKESGWPRWRRPCLICRTG